MNPDCLIYKNDISTLFLQGDRGEFELLSYHYPVLSILKEGDIIINWKEYISIKKGILRFFKNDCVVLVELAE